MKKLALLIICLLYVSVSVAEESFYVHDILYVPLRASPGPRDRIVKNTKGRQVLIKSGTKLTLESNDKVDGFRNIRTPKGYKGWIHEQYLISSPIAKHQLEAAKRKVDKATKQVASLKAKISELEASNSASEASLNEQNAGLKEKVSSLNTQNKKLDTELKRITSISRNAIKLDEQFRSISEENEKLKFDIDVLKNEKSQLQNASSKDWFMIGAGAVGLGAILAFAAPWFKPRKRPADYW